MKIEKVLGKGKIWKIFNGVQNLFRKQWASETEGNCIIASGGWTPLVAVVGGNEGEVDGIGRGGEEWEKEGGRWSWKIVDEEVSGRGGWGGEKCGVQGKGRGKRGIVLYLLLYLYIYIALLAVHTNQKRFQCERTKDKRAVLREQKEALGSPVKSVSRRWKE